MKNKFELDRFFLQICLCLSLLIILLDIIIGHNRGTLILVFVWLTFILLPTNDS